MQIRVMPVQAARYSAINHPFEKEVVTREPCRLLLINFPITSATFRYVSEQRSLPDEMEKSV